ncbi:Glyoxysomal fatty acid beta-oxidation multifunctional protein MFP-a [Seminavis robusta]|uniref:enoyl-CoA hydratase n=1 Tax=Seminavis robusta TaxID=568900 RepID=A0A9N8D4U8_9STRA|nr:Glyoxysomal fatty acid beta-oxidation multifunctional protein MFP-a [Seminavis robusta]|eukprot:Sro5_g004610.1 Glyoxysomal fatty acid beta-oxidation multifunctional protein MFP-a (808) ;mRNA; f:204600-207220
MICRPAAVRAMATRASTMTVARRAVVQGIPSLSTLATTTASSPVFTNSTNTAAQQRFQSTAAAVAEEQATTGTSKAPKTFVPTPERQYENFTNVEITADGVAIIRFDCANQSVNTISFAVADEAKTLWAKEIEHNDNVKAVVFASAKPGTFIAGADIKDIKACENKQDLVPIIEDGVNMFQKIRAKKIPLVVAIDGVALGGGLEWCLWCDYRICTDSPKTKMGLPEVKLGLLPGFGGTQKLPQLVGVQAALDMMLTGKDIRPAKAKKMGLVDLVVAPASLEQVAIDSARQMANGTLKPKRKQKSTMNKMLEDNQYGRKIIWNQVEKMVNKQTNGNYPAPFAIMQSVEYGLQNPGDKGLKNEREQFAKLAATSESAALINIFEGMTAMKKHNFGADAAVPVKNIAVMGAGLMGAGISQVSVEKGKYNVMLKDRDDAGVGRGMSLITDAWKKKLQKKRMTQYQANINTSSITPLTDDNPVWEKHFSQADVVIEAVFEDLDLKKRIVKEMERVTPEHCIFASNTSAIPITKIAEGAGRPENIIGMHYFSPVPMMPLLEIIPHEGTSDAAKATAFEVGTKQGKTCIVTKDVPGFYVNRCLGPFLVEVSALARDGVSLEMLDKSMTKFGMPVGPVTLADEVGIDIASHVATFLSEADLGVRMTGGDVSLLQEMVNRGWLGKKSGQGFYTYPKGKGKKKFINDEVKQYAKMFVENDLKLEEKEVQDRLVSRFINEAAKCVEDEIIESPEVGDIGLIFGTGFAPFRGGPFTYLDQVGVTQYVDMMHGFADKYGPQFEPCQLLKDYAATGKKFRN